MIIKLNSFLQKLSTFPDKNFCNNISNRLWFNMITDQFNIIFVWFKNKVKELFYIKYYICRFFSEQNIENFTVITCKSIVNRSLIVRKEFWDEWLFNLLLFLFDGSCLSNDFLLLWFWDWFSFLLECFWLLKRCLLCLILY